MKSGRFLDPPEFSVFHDKGNEENIFDRVDYNFRKKDTHAREFPVYAFVVSDAEHVRQSERVSTLAATMSANTDQRSKIGTFNVAPTWTRLIGSNAVFTLGAFVRRDQYNYYPSNDPFADFGPINSETIAKDRTLTNAGVRSDFPT